MAVLCRPIPATADDDPLKGFDVSTAEPAAPDNWPEDALTTGTAEAPEEAEDSLFEAKTRPLESRSRLMRCKSVPNSAACW